MSYLLFFLLFLLLFSCKNIQGLQSNENQESSLNIYNETLESCSHENSEKTTGFYRDGYCDTGPEDQGTHTVCARVTDEFLEYTDSTGNDLITPRNNFPGLIDGDYWCLCALRWKQAYDENPNFAPRIKLNSTHKKTLEYINQSILEINQI